MGWEYIWGRKLAGMVGTELYRLIIFYYDMGVGSDMKAEDVEEINIARASYGVK